jgi:hypothetical protein
MRQMINKLTDPAKLKKLLMDNMDALKFWVPFAVAGTILFWMFSDWDFRYVHRALHLYML